MNTSSRSKVKEREVLVLDANGGGSPYQGSCGMWMRRRTDLEEPCAGDGLRVLILRSHVLPTCPWCCRCGTDEDLAPLLLILLPLLWCAFVDMGPANSYWDQRVQHHGGEYKNKKQECRLGNQMAADLAAARSSVRTSWIASAWNSHRRKSLVDASLLVARGRQVVSPKASLVIARWRSIAPSREQAGEFHPDLSRHGYLSRGRVVERTGIPPPCASKRARWVSGGD
jgi:hypothetical protein